MRIAESLLDVLRKFDQYKLNDLNLDMKTVAHFSVYADKKQKQIVDWLYKWV